MVLAPAELTELVRAAVAEALAEHEPEPRPALLDGQALARELGCCERQVRRLVAEGLPCVRVGETRRYNLADVLGWLRRRPGVRGGGGGVPDVPA